MAVITSAQSGNFSAGSTWVGGVAPVNADNFIIATGHTVTLDTGMTIPATGFDDSTVNGNLVHQASATTTLRMNGRLTVATNGLYHMRANAVIEFRGTAAESHGLQVNGQAGASFIAEGVDGMPSTTLSGNINEYSTSLPLTSAANFAAGEWIAIYNNTTAQTGNGGATTLRDEGLWIHDKDNNTVYFRKFVGPEATVVSASGTTLVVSNSKVFRIGQQIIFGTGANRNVKSITAINNNTNTITVNEAITGTVTGVTVYETGTDKIHASGDKVRKVATVTTVASLSTATTITVANATNFAIGDEIWIEARSECGGNTDYLWNAYGSYGAFVKTVSGVSGNVITLNAQIGYNVVAGALVTRMTRAVQVRTVTDTDVSFVNIDNFTTNYTRKLVLKDVYFRRQGTTSGGSARGVTMIGQFSTNSPIIAYTETIPAWNQQPWLEGITYRGTGQAVDLGGFFVQSRYAQNRCCVATAAFDGILTWYNAGASNYNNISAGNGRFGFRVEGSSEWFEWAYNYSSRNGEQGYRMFPVYEDGCGAHNIISDATQYGLNHGTNTRGLYYYRHRHTGLRFGVLSENASNGSFYYSTFRFLSGLTLPTSATPGTPQRGFFFLQMDRGHSGLTQSKVVEADFEIDKVEQYGYLTYRVWDSVEQAWRVYNSYDVNELGVTWSETIYVPWGATLRCSCEVKLAPNFSGTFPVFYARSTQMNVGPNQLQNATGNWGSWIAGGFSNESYTAAAATAYERKEITVSPVNFPRAIQVGVYSVNTSAAPGWWMKDPVLILDTPYQNPGFNPVNQGSDTGGPLYTVNNSFNNNRVRLGGRIR